MNWDNRLDVIHQVQSDIWVDKVNAARVDGRMAGWASTLLGGRRCRIEEGFLHGSYNLCQKVVSDNTTWILRLVRGGKVRPEYADEKVAVEVEVLALLRHRTSIPVPAVHCWGLAADNPLGLGPYILMDFIEGVSANAFPSHPDEDTRILREDISERINRVPVSTVCQLPVAAVRPGFRSDWQSAADHDEPFAATTPFDVEGARRTAWRRGGHAWYARLSTRSIASIRWPVMLTVL
jgi:hypothetical protein